MRTRTESDDRHLDALALDALRAGQGTPAAADHVAACPRCRAALAGIVRLQETLTDAQPRLPEVPRDLELRIVRAYRESLGRSEPAPFAALVRRWTLPASGLAAVAVAALALRLSPPTTHRAATRDPGQVAGAPAPASVPVAGPESPPAGPVDIVDAFRLARALRDGRQVAAGWDADGNGKVEDHDVRLLARRAVAL